MQQIILILGAPNDKDGTLGKIALDRLDCAYSIYLANPHARIICTGGFGAHFNTAPLPHAHYAQQYLVNKGTPETLFLAAPLSANTVEDFRMVKPMILENKPHVLSIVTSDFHVQRARILQNIIINYPHVVFIPAVSTLNKAELEFLKLHESNAIKTLAANNGILY